MSAHGRYVIRRRVIDPVAGTEQSWGWLNFLSDEETTGIRGVTVGTAQIHVGKENPLHVHPNCAEIILFLAGTVEHVVGEEVIEVSQGDVLIVPAGMPHKARNIGPGAVKMLVVYNSGRRGFQLAE